jgi:membrane-bound lytic murein transglycosylase D
MSFKSACHFIVLSSLSSALLSSCASTGEKVGWGEAPANRAVAPSPEDAGASQQVTSVAPQLPAPVASSQAKDPDGTAEDGNEIHDLMVNGVPPEMEAAVNRWIHFFTQKQPERFARFLARGEKYKPMVTRALEKNGLPKELYYLAMIESGFATGATSHARAVGIWQFIPGTGKRYGLKISRRVDERRDPMRSTEAATLYLKDLHNVFQSWFLAMAAYNAGEGRILRAIMTGNSRDFWTLVKKNKLPKETMNYIPKFIAAVMIGEHPERYGFNNIEVAANPKLISVTVPSPMLLASFAATTQIPLETVRLYNPQIRGKLTPASVAAYKLWVPAEYRDNVEGNKDKFERYVFKRQAPSRVAVRAAPVRSEPASPRFHVVKKGQSLAFISKKYNLKMSYLKKINNLRSNHIQSGSRLRLSSSAASSKVRRRAG